MSTKLIIAGGSGSIGGHIIAHLKASFEDVVVLSRGASEQKEGYRIVHWDAERIGDGDSYKTKTKNQKRLSIYQITRRNPCQ